MAYPSFPATGTFPVFLDPFDPTYMTDAIGAIHGSVTSPVFPIGGGLLVIDSAWGVGFAVVRTPRQAIFAWAYVNIVPVGRSGVTETLYIPGIVGPRFVYWATDPGGLPFST